jgi:hypothetical protein
MKKYVIFSLIICIMFAFNNKLIAQYHLKYQDLKNVLFNIPVEKLDENIFLYGFRIDPEIKEYADSNKNYEIRSYDSKDSLKNESFRITIVNNKIHSIELFSHSKFMYKYFESYLKDNLINDGKTSVAKHFERDFVGTEVSVRLSKTRQKSGFLYKILLVKGVKKKTKNIEEIYMD